MQLTLEQKQQLIWKVLKRRWPNLFRYRNRVPLAIGIREQVLAEIPTIDQQALRRVLRTYFRSYGYLAALSHGGDRFNLDGTIAGPVLQEHSEHARKWMDGIKEAKRRKQTAG